MTMEKKEIRETAAAAAMEVEVESLLKGERGSSSGWRTGETLLRVTSMGLCVVALVVMLRNRQSNEYGSLSYSDLSGFQYLVYANGICAAYSLVSAFYSAVPRPLTLARAWAFFLLDQMLTYLVLTAAAAAVETLFLAYRGNKEVAWSEACTEFDGFCGRAKTSVGITFVTIFCYIAISVFSSFRLFSTYEVPIPFLIGKSAGVAAFPG